MMLNDLFVRFVEGETAGKRVSTFFSQGGRVSGNGVALEIPDTDRFLL
jgi:hypothetical protein